jgi:fumarylacetoacetase
MVARHSPKPIEAKPGRSPRALNRASSGSLLELSGGGQEPIRLASGEERRFLQDGDEVIAARLGHGN